ncbi:hypothetical protein HAP94_16270, partial [Acidithiobacillus ferrivorans]|nr:hypothetical protein [Acidithiobacillus ferrivorans]
EYIGAQLTGVGSTAINSTTANSAYNMLTPGGIFDTAGNLIGIFSHGVNAAIMKLHWYQIGDAFVYGLSEVLFIGIILLVFAMLAISLSLALIESYIVLGGGVIFLAFGASRWTMPFAEKYISYAVSIGVKLFAFYLVLGIGAQMAHAWANDLTTVAGQANGTGLVSLVFLAGMAFSLVLYGYVAMKVPSIASAFITGAGGFMSGGDLASTVATAAAMGTAAALTGGAALGAAGAMGAGGVGMATKAAGALANAAGGGASAMSGLASQATGAASDMATSAMNGMANSINTLGGNGGGGGGGGGGGNPTAGGGNPVGGDASPVAGQAAEPAQASGAPAETGGNDAVTGEEQPVPVGAGSSVASNSEQTAVGDGNVASPSSDASSVDSGPVPGMQATGQSQVNAGTESGGVAQSAPSPDAVSVPSPGQSSQNAQEVQGQDQQNTNDTGKGGGNGGGGGNGPNQPKPFSQRTVGEHLANMGKQGGQTAKHLNNLDPVQGHGAINIHLEV